VTDQLNPINTTIHTTAIEEARSEGKLAVGRFIRMEKRFADKRPILHVDGLGDANALLQNTSHFQEQADLLLRRGVQQVSTAWGGWLGQYKTELKTELRDPDRRRSEKSGRGGRST
jgi:hypothetical protein